jgi:hypothetical protein
VPDQDRQRTGPDGSDSGWDQERRASDLVPMAVHLIGTSAYLNASLKAAMDLSYGMPASAVRTKTFPATGKVWIGAVKPGAPDLKLAAGKEALLAKARAKRAERRRQVHGPGGVSLGERMGGCPKRHRRRLGAASSCLATAGLALSPRVQAPGSPARGIWTFLTTRRRASTRASETGNWRAPRVPADVVVIREANVVIAQAYDNRSPDTCGISAGQMP